MEEIRTVIRDQGLKNTQLLEVMAKQQSEAQAAAAAAMTAQNEALRSFQDTIASVVVPLSSRPPTAVHMPDETALGSPPCGHRAHTYTHTPLFPRPGITWTLLLSFPVFPFGHPNPKYPPPDHPGGAGSKTIGRKPITHTKLSHFPSFYVCCVPPNIRHTYVHSLSPLAITIAL